jgi:hypothetical protein
VSDDSKTGKPGGGAGPSPWLDWIQRWERAIGEPVESFVRSDAYFDLMTQLNRVRSRMTHTFEGLWEEWLHLFNMPAATDVRRLREQLSRLERQVNRIAKDLEDREEAAREAQAATTAEKPKPKQRAAGKAKARAPEPKSPESKSTRPKGP